MLKPFIVLLPLAIIAPNSADAALSDLLGVNKSIDQAVNGMQATVDRARAAAFAIEAQTNRDVTDRLDQINTTVNQTVFQVKAMEDEGIAAEGDLLNQAIATINRSTQQIDNLEAKFISDLSDLIRKADCVADKTANQYLKEALGSAGELIGTNEIDLSPPVMYEGEKKPWCISMVQNCALRQRFEIDSNFSHTYIQVRDYLIGRLNGIREDTPVESIIDTYAYLASLSQRLECFMPGSAHGGDFVYYSNLARNWRIATGF